LDAPIPRDIDHRSFRVGDLRSQGGRETEAHGPEPPGRDELARVPSFEEVRRPHLVLAHLCQYYGIPRQRIVQFVDGVLGEDRCGRDVDIAIALAEDVLDAKAPCGLIPGCPQTLDQQLQGLLGIPHHADLRSRGLPRLTRINVDVDYLGGHG
jgi:hypothetical protein